MTHAEKLRHLASVIERHGIADEQIDHVSTVGFNISLRSLEAAERITTMTRVSSRRADGILFYVGTLEKLSIVVTVESEEPAPC